jgi:hypothetical protein
MNGEITIKHFLARGYVTKRDRFLSLIIPFYSIIIANRIFSCLEKQHPEIPTTSENTVIAPYHGSNSAVHKIQTLLQATPHGAIVAALVHGSIGDLNEIAYSDFDGILLIESSKIQSALQLHELRQLIKKSESIFLEQDALQHHGWAIFTTNDLLQFNDHLFPFNIIRESKCIFPGKEISLNAHIHAESEQYKLLLKRLCASIFHKTKHLHTLKNQYIFKNLLSEIMLLPAAFLQAKYYKPIQKQDSFFALHRDFPDIDTDIINWASEIRLNWKQEKINTKTKLFHRLKDAGLPVNFLAPKTPPTIFEQLNEGWKLRVVQLCESLLKNVD